MHDAWQRVFRDDGVVHLPGVLAGPGLEAAERAFRWSLLHPGPGARAVLAGRPGAFYQDHAHPLAFAAYRPLVCDTGLADVVAQVLSSRHLWLLYEQVWLKEGDALPTPWHQDLPYVPLAGDQLATVWINLDPVAREESLELVRGSHRGPLYNPTAFDAHDPSAAMFAAGTWPALPDVEATRDAWPIVSWPIAPGDVVVFHPATLHGGAGTRSAGRRRTISLRFFGDDARCAARPESGLAPVDRLTHDHGHDDPMLDMALRPPGSPFRHPGFPQVR